MANEKIGLQRIQGKKPDAITIDQNRCTCCESCVDVCVGRIFESTGDGIALTDPAKCLLCGHCMAICPADAIHVAALDPSEFEPIQEPSDAPDPDHLMGLFRRRRSIRRYQDRPVEKEKIVQIIDQRDLPHQFIIEDLTTVEQVSAAIKDMHVRGAGLIGADLSPADLLKADLTDDFDLTRLEKDFEEPAIQEAADGEASVESP